MKSFGISDRMANALYCDFDIPGHFHAKCLSGRSAWGSRAPWGGLKCLVRSKESHREPVSGNTCPQQSHFKSSLNKSYFKTASRRAEEKRLWQHRNTRKSTLRCTLTFVPVFGALHECIFNFCSKHVTCFWFCECVL